MIISFIAGLVVVNMIVTFIMFWITNKHIDDVAEYLVAERNEKK